MKEDISTASSSPATDARLERIGDRVAIFKITGSPFWYIRYSVGGKQIRRSLKTKSRKRAKVSAKRIDAELTLNTAKPPEKPTTIDAAIAKYIGAKQLAQKIGDGTASDYVRSLTQFAAFAKAKGIVRLDRIDEELLENFQQALQTTGMKGVVPQRKRGRRLIKNKSRTVRNKLKTVRQLMKWCLRRRLLTIDFASGFELPPEPEGLAYCWTHDEHQRLRVSAEQPWLDIFDFLALTGLRSDELCWLTKKDLHLHARPFVHVRKKDCPFTGKTWKPKHGRERIVPLCKEAVAIAKRALESSRGEWLFWSLNATSKQKGHFRPHVIWMALQRAKKTADVNRGTVHTFRHVFCSFMANNKVSPFKVMKIMGHGSLDIVLLYYHLSDDELLGALDEVEFDRLVRMPAASEGDLAKF